MFLVSPQKRRLFFVICCHNQKIKALKKAFLLSLIIISISCGYNNNSKKETSNFYITDSIVRLKTSSGEEILNSTKTRAFEGKRIFFSITKSRLGGFHAQYKIEKKGADGIYTEFYRTVTDKDGVALNYETPMDFLNFMNDLGYELTKENDRKHGKVYTFSMV